MAITRDEVVHVARLARLALTEEEIERFAAQLNAILEAVGKVAELDLEGVEPTAHPLELVERVGRGRAAAARCPSRRRSPMRPTARTASSGSRRMSDISERHTFGTTGHPHVRFSSLRS